ncbi:MAG: DNRLRE domain-containing protein [Tepidisphaeraceae bacterium]
MHTKSPARGVIEGLESRRLLSTVTGFTFSDRNANGAYESGSDFPLSGATAYLDLDDNGALDAGEPSDVSDSGGAFAISSDTGGVFRVRVEFPQGYTSSFPADGYADVFVADGQTASAGRFGAWVTGAISGSLYHDHDADGSINGDDSPILNGKVYADLNGDGDLDADEPWSQPSIASQLNWRLDLKPGTYTFRVQFTDGFIQSVPAGNGGFTRTLTAGLISIGNAFAGYSTGRAGGYTFDDRDADGVRDANEVYLPGRTVYVDLNQNGALNAGEPSKLTEPATASFPGTFSFDLAPGTYQIRHLVPTGWERTLPSEAAPLTLNVRSGFGNFPTGLGSRELGKVTGTVFNDLDADGVKDTGEGPIPSSPIPWVWLDLDNDLAREAGEPQVQPAPFTGNFELHAPAGQYTLRVERQTSAWVHSSGGASRSVSIGEHGWVTPSGDYGLYQGGTVRGRVFNDLDGDRQQGPGEINLSNRTVYVDLNQNGAIDAGEPSAISNANGYNIAGVPAGSQQVRQVLPADWLQTTPLNNGPSTVTLTPGQLVFAASFGTRYNFATLDGNVFEDLDGDGVQETGEGPLAGFTGFLDANNNAFFDTGERSAVSNSAGIFQIDQVMAGTHVLRVVGQASWEQTLPAGHQAGRTVTVAAGQIDRSSVFGFHYDYNSIAGNIFNDADADGTRDTGESGLSGKRVYLDLNNDGDWDGPAPVGTPEPSVFTDTAGNYTFAGLLNGTYVVRQVLDSGWRQTQPVDNVARTVQVARGQNATGAHFGATSVPQNGYIAGFIYDDLDADGVRDSNETTYLARTIWLDTDNDGVLDAGERSTTSPANDSFIFFDVPPGTYNVRASVPAGWRQTSPANSAAYVYTVAPGQTGAIFIGQTRQVGWIDGIIFNDIDGDGVRDGNEGGAQGRSAYLDLDNDSTRDANEPTATADSIGHYQFAVLPGTYTIRTLPEFGYAQIAPANNGAHTVTAVANQARNAPAFGVRMILNSIGGSIFNDADVDGVFDAGEALLPDVVTYIDANDNGAFDPGEIGGSAPNGNYLISGLTAGTYIVRLVRPSGYQQSAPAGPNGAHVVTVGTAENVTGRHFGLYVPAPQTPYNGAPFAVGPSAVTIQAEHFDKGGEGVAYHDTDAGNGGAAFRATEGVDLKLVAGSTTNYRVNGAYAGEYIEYSINVAADGNYDLDFRVSSKGSNGKFHVEVPDVAAGPVHLGSFTIPNTGSHDTYQTLTKRVYLPAGQYVLRLVIDQDSTYGSAGNFDTIKVTPATVTPPPPTGTVTVNNTTSAYVRNGSYAGQNFGNDGQLIVKSSANVGNTREGYLKFDVSSLPSDPNAITNVKLRVYGKKSASGTNPNIAVFGVADTGWSEGSINWNNKPASAGAALASKTLTSTSNGWHEFDITSYVKQARQSGASFVTLVLRATNNTDPQAQFNSDDASSNKPQLVAQTGAATVPQALVVSNTGLSVPENGQASFTVKLAAAPTSNVTVTISKQAGSDADVNADKGTLTFTPANWHVAQMVTLSAANDADSINHQSFFSVASSGLTTVTVWALEADDDGPVSEPTVTIGESATVRDGTYAGQNFGTASELVVKRSANAGNTRETYIKFDLSSSDTVTSAKLRINARLSDTSIASLLTQIHSVSNTSWSETGITWNNKPTTGSTLRGGITVTGTSATWYELDLTSFVQAEFAAGRKIITLVLRNPNVSDAQTLIPSDETPDGPQLVVL